MSLDLGEGFIGGSTFYHHMGPEDPSIRRKKIGLNSGMKSSQKSMISNADDESKQLRTKDWTETEVQMGTLS